MIVEKQTVSHVRSLGAPLKRGWRILFFHFYPNAFGNPATVPRMWAARQPTCLFHLQYFVERVHSRTHTNEHRNCDFCFENMHHESPTNQTRWHANEQEIVVWRCLGAKWGRSWSLGGRKATPMQFRRREPRSWLTLGRYVFIRFALYVRSSFCCLFDIASRTIF